MNARFIPTAARSAITEWPMRACVTGLLKHYQSSNQGTSQEGSKGI